YVRVVLRTLQKRIGAIWTLHRHAGALRLADGGRDHLDLLAAKGARLAGVRVNPAHGDARPLDAERAERRDGGSQGTDDARAGDERERLPHAGMQGDVRDADLASVVR